MSFSESDTRAKFIDEQIKASLWKESNIIREYTFTDGRKLPGNKRGKRKSADYILSYRWVKLAIIEAKKYAKSPTDWLEQAKEYASILHIRFLYATNGQEIYEFDLKTGKWAFIEAYPTPDELYAKTFAESNLTKEILLSVPFYVSEKKPRYYQEIAIKKALEAIAEWKQRVLLTLATGTGKTVIAFQICHTLLEARFSTEWIGKRKPKILFLADRKVLINQAMNTFNPLEKDIVKIDAEEIRKRHGEVPKFANVFFAIYQALTGGALLEDGEAVEIQEKKQEFVKNKQAAVWLQGDQVDATDTEKYFRRYPKDFFDVIIIDECHRGGAREDGNWAEILAYFSSAIQIGLTATPKSSENIDTYKYFGDPVYEYDLKTGIDDGFLTPFKIKRIRLNLDEFILTAGDEILAWEAEKDFFETKEMERKIIIHERTDLIAETILHQISEMEKTIIFCTDQDHAARMRDAINKYKTHSHPDYCVRVTSNEGEIGRQFLERFQDADKDIPVILTSSQMLTTGVDALAVKNIVLVRNIGSIVEYKQIVGRGTRVFDGKDFFTIYDFMWVATKFLEEIFVTEREEYDAEKIITTPREMTEKIEDDTFVTPQKEKKETLVVRLSPTREIKILAIETYYYDPELWKFLSSEDFLMKIFGKLPEIYENEHQLRMMWAHPESREAILQKLESLGLGAEMQENLKKMFEAEKSDIFDILLYLSYGYDMKNRDERAKNAEHFAENFESEMARDFVHFLLDLYERNGILDFGSKWLASKIELFNRGQAREIAESFGGIENLRKAYFELQEEIYEVGKV